MWYLCYIKYSRHSHSIFERALTQHKIKFPPKVKPKTGRPPAWQKAVSQAVIEMENYSQDDLADGPAREDDDEPAPREERVDDDSGLGDGDDISEG